LEIEAIDRSGEEMPAAGMGLNWRDYGELQNVMLGSMNCM